VAGPSMREAGCIALADADALAVMGLVEPLTEIPRLVRLRRSLIRRWGADGPDNGLHDRPAVFVGIDAPDFNLGLEIELRRRGIPTVHYVSPSVWAWRPGRIHKIARAADKVLCLLPFEKAFYDEHGVAAEFVGHPLADRLAPGAAQAPLRAKLGVASTQVVSVLPGSRRGEVTRLGPVFVEASRLLLERLPDLAFIAPMASDSLRSLFRSQLEEAGISSCVRLTDGGAQQAMAAADVVLLASGTAALEAALLGRPMVAAYRLAPVTYALVRHLKLVRVRHFTLPNLLTETPLVPEFLQEAASAPALCGAVYDLLRDGARREAISQEFAKLRDQLARGADRLAARAVLDSARNVVSTNAAG